MFTIRLPRSLAEFTEGVNLLSIIFQDRFQAFPRELPHQFFLAFDSENGNRVVGTINLQIVKDSEEFEVERFFSCNIQDLCGVEKSKIAEIGRLTSNNDLVTPSLFCAVGKFMQRFGIEAFVSFNKKSIGRVLKTVYSLPLTIQEIPMKKKNIPAEYRSYFFDQRNPVVVLKSQMGAVEEWVNQRMMAQFGIIEIVVPERVDELDQIINEYNHR